MIRRILAAIFLGWHRYGVADEKPVPQRHKLCLCGGRGIAAVTSAGDGQPDKWDVMCGKCLAKTPLVEGNQQAWLVWDTAMTPRK